MRPLFRQFAAAFVVLCLLWGATPGWSDSTHWSFTRLERPSVPDADVSDWPRNDVDRFVLARLEKEGIAPAERADPATLLRRVTLDLTGLPPTITEIDALLSDPSESAYSACVDRLLDSPHYGERWARHWLDVARYADSAGHEFDKPRPVWKYRDWVIDSFTRGKPFDEFLLEQIAGDLLPDATVEQRVATGFQCNAIQEGGDHEAVTIDRTNAFGAAFLGLTVGCAQCHDHMFDPISQSEYFGLYAFFDQSTEATVDQSDPAAAAKRKALRRQLAHLRRELEEYQKGPDPDPAVWAARLTNDETAALPQEIREAVVLTAAERTPEDHELLHEGRRSAFAAYKGELDARIDRWAHELDEASRAGMTPSGQDYLALPAADRPEEIPAELLARFWAQDHGLAERERVIAEIEAETPATDEAMYMAQRAGQAETRVFIRGDHRNLGDAVAPGVPEFLPSLEVADGRATRLDLARWVVTRDNPLTARVTVNRVWQRYFGKGLVETSEDFGVQTPEPAHRELLDWLAVELIDSGWSLKHIHRLIVTSATYAQASDQRAELSDVADADSLLARQDRIRLEGEAIRDVALATSGLLNPRVGGPSVFPYQPEGIMDGRADQSKWVMSEGADRFRRGMYTHYWRTTPHPYLKTFDAPDAVESCTRRARSNTPLQALTLLNDPWFTEAAVALARRTLAEASADNGRRLVWMCRTCLGREPSPEERSILEDHLAEQLEAFARESERAGTFVGGEAPAEEVAAWASVARVVMNTDEFITRE